jgi:hypothetical protein
LPKLKRTNRKVFGQTDLQQLQKSMTKFMLGSFQNLYPTSCLLTELVQIYNGKYIVKASLQIEGITRTTGMAAAEIIEEAEDRARERALAIFVTTDSATTQTNALASYPQHVASPTQLTVGEADPKELSIAIATPNNIPVPTEIAKIPQTTQEIPANNLTTTIKANILDTEEKLEPKSNIISTEKLQEVHPPEPELKSELKSGIKSELKPELESPVELEEEQREYAIAPVPQKSTSSSKTKTSVTSKEPNQESPQNLNQNLNQNLSKETNEITTPLTQVEPLPEQEELFDISLESFAASVPTPEPELPFGEINIETSHTAASNVMPFPPSDYNPPEEIEIPLPPLPETIATTTSKRKKKSEPEDNSDDIAKIGVEMQRLRWTVEQGKDYLFQTYGKKSRHLLKPDELRSFRQYLESQLTPEDPLAIDPIAGF